MLWMCGQMTSIGKDFWANGCGVTTEGHLRRLYRGKTMAKSPELEPLEMRSLGFREEKSKALYG